MRPPMIDTSGAGRGSFVPSRPGCCRDRRRRPSPRRCHWIRRSCANGGVGRRPTRDSWLAADVSSAMLAGRLCRAYLVSGFGPVVMDGQLLAFPNASFDGVLVPTRVDVSFPDPARGLAEFRRVFAPGSLCRRVRNLLLRSRCLCGGILAETLSGYLSRASGPCCTSRLPWQTPRGLS